MATTMKDVARQAGVDVSTVSLAINNDPRIRVETRERILLIARDLSYHKNLLARGLRSGKSFTVGAIVDGGSTIWNDLLIGAQSVLGPRDYHLVLDYLSEASPCGEGRQIEALKSKGIDGFLIAPANERSVNASAQTISDKTSAYRALRDDNIPFVFVDRHVPGVDGDRIVIDNTSGVRSAVEYLRGLGHRSIGYLYTPGRMNTAEWERLNGFEFGMRGSAGAASVHLSAVPRPGVSDADAGYSVVRELLTSACSPAITALISASDVLTMGALRGIAEIGLKIPRDISVISVGGSPISDYLLPGITTLTISMRDLGVHAATLLYDRIQGDCGGYRETRLPMTLTIRASCAEPSTTRTTRRNNAQRGRIAE